MLERKDVLRAQGCQVQLKVSADTILKKDVITLAWLYIQFAPINNKYLRNLCNGRISIFDECYFVRKIVGKITVLTLHHLLY